VAAAAALAPGHAPTPATAPYFPHFPRGCVRADFTSLGSRVRAEFCQANRDKGAAAVVVLHGCGGFSTFDHRLATTLPDFGIATLDVDYFQLTPPPNRRGFCRGGGNAVEAMPTWIQIVNDAGTMLRLTRRAPAVGVVGWSLGGDLALAVTSASPPSGRSFGATAGFSADPLAASHPRWLPPTILLFGGTDRPLLREALVLRRKLRSRLPLALYSYAGGTHQWRGRQGAAGIAEAAAFLRRHLR
jgi:dienelactone hydrolase